MIFAMDKLYEILEHNLKHAVCACLIVDIWTNTVNADFIGLAAVLTDSQLEKEVHIINMMRMPGPHCAENIKIAVEKMVNKFLFDKSKIHCIKFKLKFLFNSFNNSSFIISLFFKAIVCDEGSSLVRIFSQIVNDKEGICSFIFFV
jgi:hypothetical protein